MEYYTVPLWTFVQTILLFRQITIRPHCTQVSIDGVSDAVKRKLGAI